jgi:hypothetical protein
MGQTIIPPPTALEKPADEPAPRPGGKTRVQFDPPARSMALLTELKEKTDAASHAEVFKNALKAYDGLITEVERGGEFLLRDRDGNIAAFRMFS